MVGGPREPGRGSGGPCKGAALLGVPVLLPSHVAQGLPAAAMEATARLRCSSVSVLVAVGPLVEAGLPIWSLATVGAASLAPR